MMPEYVRQGLLPGDPFDSIDPDGVGQLVRIAVDKARSVKRRLKIGVCGEHGGDPASIALFEDAGIDYVSCSPYRVPIARLAAAGAEIDFKFGTMIEIPRAVWVADKIAEHAEFFSFGTNDLTQMTFGYSRDDAEGGFLLKYVEDGILPENPFQTLDDVIADEMQMAVDRGRAARPGLKVGICGEHGGDPASIHKCEKIGLNYVSCSPFRVPVARLAAAQAAMSDGASRDK
jgi:phosphoenolpyruvate synthase/pyruvate phosphate dikinase